MNMTAPPPIIDSMRTLWFAHVDDEVIFTNRIHLLVDGERLGRVDCLAICLISTTVFLVTTSFAFVTPGGSAMASSPIGVLKRRRLQRSGAITESAQDGGLIRTPKLKSIATYVKSMK